MMWQVVGPGARRFRLFSWPAVAVVLLLIQAALAVAVRKAGALSAYGMVTYFLVLVLATGIAALNAVQNREAIRVFWSFLATAFGVWSLSAWSWIHYELGLGGNRPAYLVVAVPLFLHIVLMIAAVVSRPHLKLSPQRGYRTTLNFLLLLFSWVFAYAILLVQYPYTSWDATLILRGQVLYLVENLLLLAVLGAMIFRAQPPWKSIYLQLFGASALYVLGSMIVNVVFTFRGLYASLQYIPFTTASACWFVWVALRGRKLAPQLAQSIQPDTGDTKYTSLLAMLSVLAVPAVGIWELFRADEPYRTRVIRLLIVLISVFILAVFVFVKEYLANRELSSDVGLANARLRLAMESGKAVGWEWDLKTGRSSRFGDLETVLGIQSDDSVGRAEDFYRFVHQEDRQRVSEAVADAQKNHKPYAAEFRVVWPDGTLRWVSAMGKFYYSPNGEPERMLGMAHDITDRKQVEQALRQSEAELIEAQRLANVGSWQWDPRTDTVTWSEELYRIAGLDPGLPAVSYKDHPKLYTPESWDRLRRAVEEALRTGTPYELDLEMIRFDSARRWLTAKGEVRRDSTGRVVQLRGTVHDITERKMTEEALRASAERLSLTQAAAQVGVFEWDIQRNKNYQSPEMERIYGVSPGSFGGTYETWIERVHPDDRERLERQAWHHVQEGGTLDSEFRIVTPSGEMRWLFSRATVFRDSAGRAARMLGVSIDITERKKAEEALRESEARERARMKELEALFDAAPITILIATDPKCKSITANRTGSQLHRVPIGANFSKSAFPVGPPLPFRIMRDGVEIPTEELPLQRAAATGRPVAETSSTLVFEDGTERHMIGNTAPLFGEDGKPCGAVGAFLDITDAKRAEDALRVSEERLHLAIQAGEMYAFEWDPLTDIVTRSAECMKILGNDEPIQLTRRELIARVHPDDREQLAASGSQFTPEHPNSQSTYRYLRLDGSVIWLEKSARAFYDDDGRMLRMIGIISDITARKDAEEALRESEERLRLAVQAGRMYAFEWDTATDVIVRSGECADIFNWMDDPTRDTSRQFVARVHPDDREAYASSQAGLTPENPTYQTSYRVLRPDGSVIWLEANGRVFFGAQGGMLRIIGMVTDVTARKRAELALRESEERFRLVANTAPVMIWMSGPDKLRTYFNTPWLDFTGRSIESELGNGWAEGVHPEDFKTCLETYVTTFDRREDFRMEYRLRRYDGEYRWVLDIGVPRFNEDGSFSGYIGSCMDVTERKLAEEALSSVSRRLIEAHEEERTRIARDLHDDINQRLALVAIGLEQLEQLEQGPSKSVAEVSSRIHELGQRISEVSVDVQSLSRRLHSPKLDYLGIGTAARSFCKEFSEQHKVEIAFANDDIPHTVPREISLCLFRVLQEALQNAVKHSDVRFFEVELRNASDEIHLTVRDSGSGFDLEEAMKTSGIGLISMTERLKLVDGQLSIDSQPSRGTTIHARVPLIKAARAAG
jgi:PAS domain S-box-containing protein